MLFCTSVCANYLPKAAILAKSIRAFNPDAYFVVCVVERDVPVVATEYRYFDQVVTPASLGFPDYERFLFKHDIVEASTAVKGQLFRHLMDAHPEQDKFVYLDPDICVYSRLAELEDALDRTGAVLTPHLCHPETHIDAVLDNELCALRHGTYNLGFLAVSRRGDGRRLVDWWASRLEMFCYDDIPNGIFTDQKWVDLAPGFFELEILRHPGYNIAPWNLSRRKIAGTPAAGYTVNGQPLRFFHFSGFDSGANEAMINKYVPDRDDPVYEIRDRYVQELEAFGQDYLGTHPWSFARYLSGEPIDRPARIRYRSDPGLARRAENPFELSNGAFI